MSKDNPTSSESISSILELVEKEQLVLPEFQRDYVWKSSQIRDLFDSLYNGYPIGEILILQTNLKNIIYRGNPQVPKNPADILLDGQQRITTIYSVLREEVPKFYDGDKKKFKGLCFNLNEESFEFYQPAKMNNDNAWVKISDIIGCNTGDIEKFSKKASNDESDLAEEYRNRLHKIRDLPDVKINISKFSSDNFDTIVGIFDRYNSAGTHLTSGARALAKANIVWPKIRDEMKAKLKCWEKYNFSMDWLLRSVNVLQTNKSQFQSLEFDNEAKAKDVFKRASKCIEKSLNLIDDRLGLSEYKYFFGQNAIPVMVWYLDNKKGNVNEDETRKLLYWFAHAGIWGRFSGSVETAIDQDIDALGNSECDVNRIIENLYKMRGSLEITPDNFDVSGAGARFFRVLFMITRMGRAKDLFTGIKIKSKMLGEGFSLERHHIFPKAQLKKYDYDQGIRNSLGNICFITRDTNQTISDRLPEDYLNEVSQTRRRSQWIPDDPQLWKIENYLDFLKERRSLLAEEANKYLNGLRDGKL